MGFISGMIIGIAIGILLIIAFARQESTRSKRRTDLVSFPKFIHIYVIHINSHQFHSIIILLLYLLYCGFCKSIIGKDDSKVCEDDGGRF